jgi:four helix bundle protein
VRIQGFRDLTVYRSAFQAAWQIFELTKRFPPEERYSLTDQIRRSSRSVCANLAEAWKKRRYPASFISKLSDAGAEAAETQVWLDTAWQCGYLPADQHRELINRYDHIGTQLSRMMAAPAQWCNVDDRRRTGA